MPEHVTGHRRPRTRVRTGDTSPELAIMEATEKLLEIRPLHEISASAIIETAKVSRPTFYFYFPSKFAVVNTLLQRIFGEIFEFVDPWITRTPEESPAASLRVVLQAAAAAWHQHAAAIRAAHENAHADPELGTTWFAILERFRLVVSAEIRRARTAAGSDAGLDPEVLAATLIWSSERTLYMAIGGLDPHLDSPQTGAESLLAIWLPAIYGLPYTPPD